MSNGNVSGNNEDRRRRREWLVQTYRADRDFGLQTTITNRGRAFMEVGVPLGTGQPACWCYRCPTLLTVETLTVDRIIPGALGGTYRRNNIRPACKPCNDSTGGKLGAALAKLR